MPPDPKKHNETNSPDTIRLSKLITLRQTAAALGCSISAVSRMAGRGELRVYRSVAGGIVRIYAASLRDHIDRNTFGAVR